MALKVFFSVCLLILASACSSLNIGDAQRLGSEGTKASTTLSAEADSARQSFIRSQQLEIVFRGAANPSAVDPRSLISGSAYDKVEQQSEITIKLLSQRKAVYDALFKMYAAYNELVQYNAIEDFKTSYDDTTKTINQFIEIAKTLPVPQAAALAIIGDTTLQIGRIGFGIVVDERHKANIKEANLLMAAALNKLAAAVEAEAQYATSLRQISLRKRVELRLLLLQKGLLSYSEVFSAVAKDVQSDPVKQIEKALAQPTNRSVRVGLEAMLIRQSEQEIHQVQAAYASMIEVLKELAKQHEKLNVEAGISLSLLRQWTGRIEALLKK